MLWIKLKYIYYRFLYIINIILIINYLLLKVAKIMNTIVAKKRLLK